MIILMEEEVLGRAIELQKKLIDNGLTISTAESCTGGMLATILTNQSGSSGVFEGSVVSYSNEAKVQLLGVSRKTLSTFGAVSKQTAYEMALGCRARFATDIAVSITGIAGPGGAVEGKPVGTIFVGIANGESEIEVEKFSLEGNREENRSEICFHVLGRVLGYLETL